MAVFRRIMMATDFSPTSAQAFKTAVSLAGTMKGRLVVVHALLPLLDADYLGGETFDQLETAGRIWAEKELKALVAKAVRAGVRARHRLYVGGGAAADTIADAAKAERADLLVVGTHGRTGVAKMFAGSVATRLVAVAPCPVLTVRGG